MALESIIYELANDLSEFRSCERDNLAECANKSIPLSFFRYLWRSAVIFCILIPCWR